MASAKRVKSHVTQVEYIKELSRLRMERLVRQIKPEELFGNPVRLARRLAEDAQNGLLGEIGDMMRESNSWSKSLGFDPLSTKESNAIVREAVAEWRAAFEKKMTRSILDLQKNFRRDLKRGLSGDALKKALNRDAMKEKLTNEVLRGAKPQGPGLVNEVDRRLRDEALGRTKGLFTWLTLEDDHVCEDSFDTACADRHGETMKLVEWRAVGLPGSTVLLCSSFGRVQCRCELVGADAKEIDLFEKVNVADAVKAGKAKARDET